MQADPQVQEDLLELPLIDRRLAQLANERRTSELKEHATAARAALVTAEEDLVDTRTRIKDLEREIARAETDVETVRSRVLRDQQTLDSGAATPKQMTDIQHELESLARRQADLEDIELEIMERLEQMTTALQTAERVMGEARTRAEETAAAWDRREDEIVEETVALEGRRGEVAAALPADLVGLYEKTRDRSGVGAALLRQGRCGACQIVLSSTDLDRVRAAAPDEVVRCEECGAIMVRTAESGL
ncbi:MAG TPA: C4-type zinc ribbon domain-containing protein [Actinomycetota bacterium]|nr:C4-type zinc ribbon domain-containing protein [Actinomycetota bacterium]